MNQPAQTEQMPGVPRLWLTVLPGSHYLLLFSSYYIFREHLLFYEILMEKISMGHIDMISWLLSENWSIKILRIY